MPARALSRERGRYKKACFPYGKRAFSIMNWVSLKTLLCHCGLDPQSMVYDEIAAQEQSSGRNDDIENANF